MSFLPRGLNGSRRQFPRRVARGGYMAPFGSLARALDLYASGMGSAARKAGLAPASRPSTREHPGFKFVDVAAQAGLGTALNVFGPADSKRYLLEEMGCGVAFFDYDHDGWLDLFLVNGTRFDEVSPDPAPSNFLFHFSNRDGTFTDLTVWWRVLEK